MTIRPLAADDREAWLPLWQAYLDFYGASLAPAVTEKTWAEICGDEARRGGFGAVAANGEMLGFATYLFHSSTWAETDYCYLEDLYVSPQCRGQGTGRALIEAVYAEADRRKAARVYWVTDQGNEAARRLYDGLASLSDFVQYRR